MSDPAAKESSAMPHPIHPLNFQRLKIAKARLYLVFMVHAPLFFAMNRQHTLRDQQQTHASDPQACVLHGAPYRSWSRTASDSSTVKTQFCFCKRLNSFQDCRSVWAIEGVH